jgi:hypothetical protein
MKLKIQQVTVERATPLDRKVEGITSGGMHQGMGDQLVPKMNLEKSTSCALSQRPAHLCKLAANCTSTHMLFEWKAKRWSATCSECRWSQSY